MKKQWNDTAKEGFLFYKVLRWLRKVAKHCHTCKSKVQPRIVMSSQLFRIIHSIAKVNNKLKKKKRLLLENKRIVASNF